MSVSFARSSESPCGKRTANGDLRRRIDQTGDEVGRAWSFAGVTLHSKGRAAALRPCVTRHSGNGTYGASSGLGQHLRGRHAHRRGLRRMARTGEIVDDMSLAAPTALSPAKATWSSPWHGRTNAEIVGDLFMTVATVKAHVSHILSNSTSTTGPKEPYSHTTPAPPDVRPPRTSRTPP